MQESFQLGEIVRRVSADFRKHVVIAETYKYNHYQLEDSGQGCAKDQCGMMMPEDGRLEPTLGLKRT